MKLFSLLTIMAVLAISGCDAEVNPLRHALGYGGSSVPPHGKIKDGRTCPLADIDTSEGAITVRLPCDADVRLNNLGEAKVLRDGEHCLELDYTLRGETKTRVFCPS